jgi:glycosyltransferase involved in cell wall biosynthesis
VRTLAVSALRMLGRRTAMGRHIEYLAHEWSRSETPFDRIVLLTPGDISLDGLGNVTPVVVESFGERLPLILWEQVALPIRARGAAVLYCPAYTAPLMHRGALVVGNHGIYERIPGEFPMLQRLRSTPVQRASARRATRVIANSTQTRADLVEFFKVDPNKIDVVYPAANEIFFAEHDAEAIGAETERALGARDPYIIFVGKLSKRRNVPNLIEAFSIARLRCGLTHRLLIVGPNTSHVPIAELAARHGVGEHVTYLPHLEQEPLALLYAGADAFVLPTTYEGISYTMFEAMASGTPVLTVDHPTVAEGAETTVLAVPSPSVGDLVQGLTAMLTDDGLRRELRERGRTKAREFSWAASASSTMRILDQVASAAERRRH